MDIFIEYLIYESFLVYCGLCLLFVERKLCEIYSGLKKRKFGKGFIVIFVLL